MNSIRYRSYYYDTETGFYYLQSRYYDPAIRRFINPDDIANLAANGDIASLNLYAYCGNNPVARSDDGGNIKEVNWWKVGISAVEGGLSAAVGPIAGLAVSAAASVANDLADGKTDVAEIGFNAVVSVGFSSISTAVDHTVRTIAVNKLKHASKAIIKQIVTSIDSSISGTMRNVVKNPNMWSKSLKKTIFNNVLSTPTEIGLSNGLSVVSGITKGCIFGF